MKLRLICVSLLFISLFSCEKEEFNVSESPRDFSSITINEGPAVNSESFFSLCYEAFEPEDVATIDPCPTDFSLGPVTQTLPFSYFDTHDFVEEINDVFNCHEQFSTCQGAQKPQEICTRVFSLYDTEVFAIPDPAYTYFSDAMAPALSNQIVQHYACEIVDYGDQNYGNYRVAHVRFVTNQDLCTTCPGGIYDVVYLEAYVYYYVY